MAKIKLAPDATFHAVVMIPVHGAEPAAVKFTFKHRPRTETVKWLESLDGSNDASIVQEMASGWDLDDEFSEANINLLLQNYGGAGKAIFDKYLAELSGARAKN